MKFHHVPIMLRECIDALDIKPYGVYVDATVGGAGHSAEIAKRLTTGKLIGIDRDMEAIKAAEERLGAFDGRILLRWGTMGK
jgi:16S rRNA (cytosine1402-N4)-methyltransferase